MLGEADLFVRMTLMSSLRFARGVWKSGDVLPSIRESAETHELVDVILFMCSDNASFITGTNHVIDGGRLCMYQPYVAPKTKEEK